MSSRLAAQLEALNLLPVHEAAPGMASLLQALHAAMERYPAEPAQQGQALAPALHSLYTVLLRQTLTQLFEGAVSSFAGLPVMGCAEGRQGDRPLQERLLTLLGQVSPIPTHIRIHRHFNIDDWHRIGIGIRNDNENYNADSNKYKAYVIITAWHLQFGSRVSEQSGKIVELCLMLTWAEASCAHCCSIHAVPTLLKCTAGNHKDSPCAWGVSGATPAPQHCLCLLAPGKRQAAGQHP